MKHTLPQLLEKADRDPRLVAYVNGRRLELVGFPLAREREPLDAALCRFLQGQGKPLVFTTRGPPDEQGRRAEQDEVREQLATFRPHFEQLCEGILRRHVGDSEMSALRKMLESDAMKRYVHARSAMNEGLVAMMRELSHRMGETSI